MKLSIELSKKEGVYLLLLLFSAAGVLVGGLGGFDTVVEVATGLAVLLCIGAGVAYFRLRD